MSDAPLSIGPATRQNLAALAVQAPLVQMLLDAYLEGAGYDPAGRYRLVLDDVRLEPEPVPPQQGQEQGTVEGVVRPPVGTEGEGEG